MTETKKPTVTTYKEKDGWYWVQVDEDGDPWYNKPGGPFATVNEAWDAAEKYFRNLRN